MPATAQLLEDSLLLIWNDRDADRRLALMPRVYAPDMAFFESNTGPAIVGYAAINALITQLQVGWAPDFVFSLSQPAQVNHQVQHVAWTLGAPGQPPVASGMDVALVAEERIVALHLFLDAVPSAA